MTSYLRKSICMGVYQPTVPDQNFGYFAPDWAATNTAYVRFWIPWYIIAPYGPNNPAIDNTTVPPHGDPPYPPPYTVAQWVQGMDAQIAYARTLGLKVVLTFDTFPPWVNGSTDVRVPPPAAKLGLGGAWASYLDWIMTRWSMTNIPNNNGAYADFLEICNEPNLWNGTNDATAAFSAAVMMITAQAYQRARGMVSPILVGPALGDGNARGGTSLTTFATNVLSTLQGYGFTADQNFAWSHHNYLDVSGVSGAPTRAQIVRGLLQQYGWAGWPYRDTSNPYLLITEGGAKYNDDPTGQANHVANAYNAVHNDTAGQGKGLAMFTQYLDVSSPGFDTGLRSYNVGYTPHQLYTRWGLLPQP